MKVAISHLKYPLIVMMGLAFVMLTYIQIKSPSYKAKTVDECINERDCVWYAFSKIADFKTMSDGSIHLISKWQKDIQILVIDDKDGRGVQKIENTITAIQPHIPYKISIEKKFNLLILFSDNIVNDVLYKYRDEFKKTYGSDIIAQSVLRNNTGNLGCFFAAFPWQGEIYMGGGVIISNRNEETSEQCIRNSIIKSVALTRHLNNFPFSVANYPELKGQMPTQLDYLLMEMIYDPRFEKMEKISQTEEVFDEIYKEKFLVLN